MADGSVIIDTLLKTEGLNKGIGEIEGKLGSLGSKLTSTGKNLTLGLTAPLVGLGAASLNTFATFEQQMNRVKAISGATATEFRNLEKQAIDLGASSVFSATEVAQAQEMMASAGMEATDILKSMDGVMALAAVSGGDMALAGEAVATSLNMFGLEADKATHVADVFAKAAADTNAEVGDMAEALKYAGPVAGSFGLTIEETAAAVGIMSNAGIKGSQAGTTLRTALTRLADPSKEASRLMSELGLEFFDSQGKMKPMSGIAQELQGKLGGLTDQQKSAALSTLFGKESLSGMLALMNAGPAEVDRLTNSFVNSTGAAEDFASIINSGTKGSIENLKGALETAGISIGRILAPAFNEIIKGITGVIDWFNSLSPATQGVIVAIAGLLAAIGPLLLIIGTVVTQIAAWQAGTGLLFNTVQGLSAAFGFLLSPIGLVVAAIVGLIAVFAYLYTTNEDFRNKVHEVWNAIVAFLKPIIQEVVDFIMSVWGTLVSWWNENQELIKQTAERIWTEVKLKIEAVMTFLGPFLKEAWEYIKLVISVVWEYIKMIVQIALDVILGIIKAVMQLINGDWKGAWETIKETLAKVWDNIKQFVKVSSDKIVEYCKEAWERLKQNTSQAWEAIKSKIAELVGRLVVEIKQKWEELKNSVTQIAEAIKAALIAKWEAIKSSVSEAIARLVSDAKQKWEELKNSVSEAVERVKNLFNSLREINLTEIGRNIIQGLINGISSMAGAVASAISSIASNIKGRIMGALGIHSPSRWMRDMIGKNIGAGLVIGMDATGDDIERAADRMADYAKPNLNEFLPAGMADKINQMKGYAQAVLGGMSFAPQMTMQPAVVVNISNEADSDLIRQRVNAKNAQEAIINQLFGRKGG